MIHPWEVVAVSLCSAFAFAVSSSLKHASAGQVPDALDLAPSALVRFIRATLAHPLWLGGVVADLVGLTLQITALHLGALSLVQPLMISGLLFALLLRHRRAGLNAREIGWASVLTLALIAFVALTGTLHAAPVATADRIPAVIAALIGLAIVATCIVVVRCRRSTAQSAAILGIAVGATYATTAALLKTATQIATGNPWALFSSWQLYAVLALGAMGLVLSQLAFQAGPLSASLPATATVDPLLSVVIGVVIYDEQIRHGTRAGLTLVALLVILGVAVVQLVRANLTSPPHRSANLTAVGS